MGLSLSLFLLERSPWRLGSNCRERIGATLTVVMLSGPELSLTTGGGFSFCSTYRCFG